MMASYPRNIRLKGGDELTVRPCEASDEQGLLEFFKERVPEGDRLFLKDDVTDPAVIKRWISHLSSDRVFPLLAFDGDKLIGDATLHRNPYGWSQHVAEIRVVVARDWQRKGVAQGLVGELVSRAHELGLEILEAHVLEGQHAAQRALEALGFHAETVLLNRAIDRKGQKRNILVMTNDVSKLWRKMEEMFSEMELGGPLSGRY
jgi:RimJ/RimL family protein N-acetyltransferase